ncbi:hypothetical protein DBV15_01605 [Temnothorax longispinosus]|uniref:Uncharacterized protein n=1 Tax=Temnothorax longispinosus TaxID=300112 RepID=A0A4S2KY93_9HYME|nr:hypothetical protein DBV15_01605 [Temnothorax longispinosus]
MKQKVLDTSAYRHPRWIPLDHAPSTGSLPHKCGNASGRGGRLPVSRRIRPPTRSRGKEMLSEFKNSDTQLVHQYIA